MQVHILKCWPQFYSAIEIGLKTFEIRKGLDREYKVGDRLRLREFIPEGSRYTGRELDVEVQYVMHGSPFLPDDTWAMGIVRVNS